MSLPPPPLSEVVRLHQIGAGLERNLRPDAQVLARIARLLDLAELPMFEADLRLTPREEGWRLSGDLRADAVQTCGLTLDPLPVSIRESFTLDMVEAGAQTSGVIDLDPEADGPDEIEGGAVDIGVYAVEQLALRLDPFPRRPDAVFEPPQTTAEISPFAVLAQLKNQDSGDKG